MFSKSSKAPLASTYATTGSAFDYNDWADTHSSSTSPPSFTARQSRNLFLLFSSFQNCYSKKTAVAVCAIIFSAYGYATLIYLPKGAVYVDPEVHYKASILRLSPPFDRLRDSVFDQPVRMSDVVFYWQTRDAGEEYVPGMLGECFGLTLAHSPSKQWEKEPELRVHKVNGIEYINVDTTTLDGIQRAKKLKLTSSLGGDKLVSNNVVIVSPFLREVSDIMTEDNQGRIFAFFRHPIEREAKRGLAGILKDNDMTRNLINKPTGELNFVDLGMAKKVIREKVVIGLLDDNLGESVTRIAEYFGWKGSDSCIEKYTIKLPTDLFGDLVDGTSAAWRLLEPYNIYDIQLYEHARSVFRSQKQTVVSLDKQLATQQAKFKNSDGDDEE